MNTEDKYLFDLTGYLVLKDVLTPEEVAELNAGIDRHRDLMSEIDRPLSGDSKTMQGTSRRKDLGGMLAWDRPYCEPFRKLLVHPRIKPYLEEILGPRYRSTTARTDRHGHRLRGRAFARRRSGARGHLRSVLL